MRINEALNIRDEKGFVRKLSSIILYFSVIQLHSIVHQELLEFNKTFDAQ